MNKSFEVDLKDFSAKARHLLNLSFILQRLMTLIMLKLVCESALSFSKHIQFHQFAATHESSFPRREAAAFVFTGGILRGLFAWFLIILLVVKYRKQSWNQKILFSKTSNLTVVHNSRRLRNCCLLRWSFSLWITE